MATPSDSSSIMKLLWGTPQPADGIFSDHSARVFSTNLTDKIGFETGCRMDLCGFGTPRVETQNASKVTN